MGLASAVQPGQVIPVLGFEQSGQWMNCAVHNPAASRARYPKNIVFVAELDGAKAGELNRFKLWCWFHLGCPFRVWATIRPLRPIREGLHRIREGLRLIRECLRRNCKDSGLPGEIFGPGSPVRPSIADSAQHCRFGLPANVGPTGERRPRRQRWAQTREPRRSASLGRQGPVDECR